MPRPEATVDLAPVRVFVSYAHDTPQHVARVRRLCTFLRKAGVDVTFDLPVAERRQDWAMWTFREIHTARFVLVIASPEYRRRAEGEVPPDEGRGVQWEARLIMDEVYRDQDKALDRFLPVVLEGCSADDIPAWLGRASRTHYTVSSYTVRGAEKLLRLLTSQPTEVLPPLGSVPLLPAKAAPLPAAITEEAGVRLLVRRLANRTRTRSEATVQADVRQLLRVALGVDEYDLSAEHATSVGGQRRINVESSFTIIEVRNDLRVAGVTDTAERRLARHLASRGQETGARYAGVLTDGAQWRLYQSIDEELRLAMPPLTVDPFNPDVGKLLLWLDGLLATGQHVTPSPRNIVGRLGAESPSYALDAAELAAIYEKYRDRPTVKVKRELWAKLLTTALGTNFTDEDSLFVNHTLLVAMAEVIGHGVVGLRPDNPETTATTIMSGTLFSEAQIGGVIEADFFDWVVHVPGGEQFIKNLARRLARFAWDQVEHDVMKVLYESIISREIRHRLGEYYTPDWLAEEIVAECVDDPLAQRVLDASCGSGTFLFHAVRAYLAAADTAQIPNGVAVHGAVRHVMGIDVHPVAVTLARVTYLLAIGKSRLQAEDRPAFSVPVYLGDSLRWGQESTLFSYPGLSVSTDEKYELFSDPPELTGRLEGSGQLTFPDQVLGDAGQFDRLMTDLADLATKRDRGSPVPSLAVLFHSFGIQEEDQPVLTRTFKTMCELHDQERDHIWGYYVRNLARPVWLAKPENRIDVLVGNPPWLFYRYMTTTQQVSFRAMSTERRLWAGATVATNQDLSALFVARCIELYLRPGGRFGYVMPWGTLSRRQYVGFRTGYYPVTLQPVTVAFEQPWDLHRIKPTFFEMPASVVFGRRVTGATGPTALSQVPEGWSGRIDTYNASRAQILESIDRTLGELPIVLASRASQYAARFSQGATVVPRFLFLVEPGAYSPLGVGAGHQTVRSRRSTNEKRPWKDLPPLCGTVESQFVRPLYLGDSIMPFRCLQPLQAVIPWDDERLLHGDDARLNHYRGLAKWWRSAESVWMQHRSSQRLNLTERLNYRHGLSQQFPAPAHRVVYTKSGMYLAAAIVSDPTAVIDHKLYWGSATSVDEARFLIAILNSGVLTLAVRPLQARGEHNPRDFDKYIFQLPIPLYDPTSTDHAQLVDLAARAEQIAANVQLPSTRFEAQRRCIRRALADDSVGTEIDAIVKLILT